VNNSLYSFLRRYHSLSCHAAVKTRIGSPRDRRVDRPLDGVFLFDLFGTAILFLVFLLVAPRF